MATYSEFKMEFLARLREDMTEEEKIRVINENFKRIEEHFDRLAALNIA